ncbi:apoptosis regulatory protein Siva [Linepithema humile]|uniref:apoptosis regulatory protein Siva n=1 Tax=Linepithema humile TaxID=83485 RepID=UPI0006236D7C|nr:PREDICTED: apoptosis regulatory protein Siva-like [Linepithema humile]
MPKRTYPFEENLLPQVKVHVEEKHVNNGVSSEERMKDVYDKTLSLLKTGAKTYVQRLNRSHMESIDLSSSELLLSSKIKSSSNLKQMLLTDKLQLKASDKIMNDVGLDLCGCCQLIDQSVVHKCYYCDQVLCSSCLSACAGCSELFCQNCFLPVYNYEDQVMCLNCYR